MKKVIVIFCSLLLSGCFKPVALPETYTYTLNASSDKQLSRYPNMISLQVLPPVASSYYISNKMYYQLRPHSLQAYSQNRWLAPPIQMLLPLLVQSLTNSNYYHAVIAAPTNVNTRYRLATRLIDFYQDFTVNPSQITLSIQAILINNNTNQVIASREFNTVVPTATNNPYGGVIAANMAVQNILTNIVQFCVANS